MLSFGTILTTFGTLLLAHAAFSTQHYRTILQDLGSVATAPLPPMDVYMELAMGLTLLFVGQLVQMGRLQTVEVIPTGKKGSTRKPLHAAPYQTRNFDLYQHRKFKVL